MVEIQIIRNVVTLLLFFYCEGDESKVEPIAKVTSILPKLFELRSCWLLLQVVIILNILYIFDSHENELDQPEQSSTN